MTLKDWADLAQVTLFPAIFVSLSGLWFTLNDSRKRAIESHNAQWQKVVIYSLLEKKPLSISEITSLYTSEAAQFGLAELGKDRVSKTSVIAAVLELISTRAIVRLPRAASENDDRFGPLRIGPHDPAAGIRAMFDYQFENFKLSTDVRSIIEQNDGKFTESELSQHIRMSTNLGPQAVQHLPWILSSLELQGHVFKENQKLFYRNRQVPRMPTPPISVTPPAPKPSAASA